MTKDEIAHAEEKMRKLPSVVDSERAVASIVQQIADAAETIAPELDWYPIANGAQGTLGCPSPYLETNGVSRTTGSLTSAVPISDSDWPAVLSVARDIAGRNGLTSFTVRVDVAGRHDVVLHSPDDGNEIKLGTYKAALVNGSTGCRFTEEDLRKQPGN
ncbi:LppA family lipoprotein [Nocardia callitridis]|uniref:LppA family lipoprotein n=1 Tax=Nocardia callitridis TaxID=648753 RepID=UPI0031EE7EC4